jgi:Holliday junction resolvase
MKTKRQIAINNKRRGKRLEADIVALAKSLGYSSKRAWGSNGEALGYTAGVDVVLNLIDMDFKIQCKMMKKMSDKYLPSEEVQAQVIRADNGPAMILLPYTEFLNLIQSHKKGPSCSPQSLTPSP